MLRRTDRLISSRFLYPTTCISIHAPTNGATRRKITHGGCYCYFNPRSDERSDSEFCIDCIHSFEFQSTLRRTERRYSRMLQGVAFIFQSTLRRTERRMRQAVPSVSLYFNPRSDERSDYKRQGITRRIYNFNPRSDERSDLLFVLIGHLQTYFNPRSDERSDKFSNNGLCALI